jgi:hypothetical protein
MLLEGKFDGVRFEVLTIRWADFRRAEDDWSVWGETDGSFCHCSN